MYHGANYVSDVSIISVVTLPSLSQVHCLFPQAAPMYHQRCYVAVTVLEELLYACGGYDGRTRMQSVERYDPETNQWSLMADMHCRRSDAGAEALNGQ